MPVVADCLLACSSCGGFFRWCDDRLTVKEHTFRGKADGAHCPGSGTKGIDLGPRELYYFTDAGDLLFVGNRSSVLAAFLCPLCQGQASLRMAPDGALQWRARVHVRCPMCRGTFGLAELRESPQGVWVPRRKEED